MRRKVSALPSHSQYSHHCHPPPASELGMPGTPCDPGYSLWSPNYPSRRSLQGERWGGDCEPCFWWAGNNNTGGMNQYFFLLRDLCLFQKMVSKSVKNSHILPIGQSYAPSAVNYSALSCTILHYLALSFTILHYLAHKVYMKPADESSDCFRYSCSGSES